MHANGWRSERVVGGENESAPILAAMVRSVLRTGDDVMPPCHVSKASHQSNWRGYAHSRMLVSEG